MTFQRLRLTRVLILARSVFRFFFIVSIYDKSKKITAPAHVYSSVLRLSRMSTLSLNMNNLGKQVFDGYVHRSEYQHLIQTQSRKQNPGAAHWIMNYKPAGLRSKEEIDRQIANERNSWDLV